MYNPNRAARAAESPLHLDRQKVVHLTRKVNETYAKLDATLAHTLRLSADMIETSTEMGLEPETGQKLFMKFNKFISTLSEGRAELIAAHLQATRIRLRTNQAETSEGCLPPPVIQPDATVTPLRAVG